MNGRRTSATGSAGALVAAVAGASFGWFVIGPPTQDPEIHGGLGLLIGALLGFGLAGPPRAWLFVLSVAVSTVLAGFGGGWLTQDEGLGSILGVLVGAVIGLITGIVTYWAKPPIKSRLSPYTSSPTRKRLTPDPTACPRPAMSDPSVRRPGRRRPPSRAYIGIPRKHSQSERLTEVATISTSTCFGPGVGVGTSSTRRTAGGPY